ncbi:DUF58 domain-containing protein [Paludisphaera rhizosphaerae]|uniref:DUF58 domain-containing protein n=1 Tax=Paludisphaera rhizosphaerae TaxID=2711216 RepID=UPI0013EADC3D|nr:DUF58 domain-containing protein [Paludisphaera rhizosphaerae]
MIIPSRRMMWLTAIPLVVILGGRGAPAAVGAAWTIMGMLAAAFIADGLLARRLPIRLTRRAPDQLHVGQTDRVAWTVENRLGAPVRLILADQPPEGARATPLVLEVEAPPRSRTTHEYEIVPTLRGPTAFGDLNYRALGPLGIAWAQRRLPAGHSLRCMPQLANARAAELAERRALLRQAGSHRFRWRGTGTSFESLREYSTQDDIRWVDWKATARLNRPISRNFEVERHQQVVVLVDSSRAMTTYCGHRTKFDAMLEAAVLLTRTALGQGDDLGLMVFADKVDLYLHPRRERTQLNAVIEGLYAREPRLVEPNFELALTLAAKRSSRRTLFILLTDVTVVEAARRMLLYSKVLTRRHLFLVVTIADETLEDNELHEPHDAAELYRVGVAAGLMQERTILLEELRRSGVEVLDSRADQVAPRAIERYLDLKRRNML